MTSLLRAVVAALVAAFLGWFAVAPLDAVASPASMTAIYTYDCQHHSAGLTYTTAERRPPDTYGHTMTAHHAETPWSLGVSTCPARPTTPGTYAYHDLGSLAQIARRSGGVERQVGSIEARSVVVARSNVAANTADDIIRLGTRDSWGNLSTLDDHFARHGADFGATFADDYARQASEFLQQPGTLTRIDPKTGAIRVYNPATEAFVAYNPSGTTLTFYVPDPAVHGYPTNLAYWIAQPE